jgi:hypothetical protein
MCVRLTLSSAGLCSRLNIEPPPPPPPPTHHQQLGCGEGGGEKGGWLYQREGKRKMSLLVFFYFKNYCWAWIQQYITASRGCIFQLSSGRQPGRHGMIFAASSSLSLSLFPQDEPGHFSVLPSLWGGWLNTASSTHWCHLYSALGIKCSTRNWS